MWENSPEYEKIGTLMAKNRKQLIEQFRRVLGPTETLFRFEQGRAAMDDWLYAHFKTSIDD